MEATGARENGRPLPYRKCAVKLPTGKNPELRACHCLEHTGPGRTLIDFLPIDAPEGLTALCPSRVPLKYFVSPHLIRGSYGAEKSQVAVSLQTRWVCRSESSLRQSGMNFSHPLQPYRSFNARTGT